MGSSGNLEITIDDVGPLRVTPSRSKLRRWRLFLFTVLSPSDSAAREGRHRNQHWSGDTVNIAARVEQLSRLRPTEPLMPRSGRIRNGAEGAAR